jgi:carbamoyltransferase
MIVLGLSAFFHDSAAALLVDGELVAAAAEERFSRIKHDAALPVQAARFCLDHAGLTMSDVDHVVFYEKPLRKFERILTTHLREFPRSLPQFPRSLATWLGQRLWMKSDLCRQLGCAPEHLLFSEHHLSHAASAFFSSPFSRAAILTVDGVGEWATTSIYRGISDTAGSRIELCGELHFPHSIGLLYSAITAYLGFEVNEGEYKVMGLASWGQPRYRAEFERLCAIGDDASLTLDMNYFCYQRHPTRSFTPALEALLGPARTPGAPLDLRRDAGDGDAQRFADVAASLQELTERYLLRLAEEAQRRTGERDLCLAGGVALNCVANRRLQDQAPFDGVFVQPAAGDAGGALGAAQWATHVLHGLPRRAPMKHAFYGAAYSNDQIAGFLRDCGVEFESFDTPAALEDAVARRLAAHQVGGWFQGRFEWGPRALGARSILADPRDPQAQDRVNRKIKFREAFRPFAPAVLADEADRWFALPPVDHLAPFMCSVAPVTDEGRAQLPAVTHVDGTARVQRIERADNPGFYDLVAAFRRRTGVGVLLNTSMNLKDEPLCASPAEAFGVFARSDLDFLALERCLVSRREVSA